MDSLATQGRSQTEQCPTNPLPAHTHLTDKAEAGGPQEGVCDSLPVKRVEQEVTALEL